MELLKFSSIIISHKKKDALSFLSCRRQNRKLCNIFAEHYCHFDLSCVTSLYFSQNFMKYRAYKLIEAVIKKPNPKVRKAFKVQQYDWYYWRFTVTLNIKSKKTVTCLIAINSKAWCKVIGYNSTTNNMPCHIGGPMVIYSKIKINSLIQVSSIQ